MSILDLLQDIPGCRHVCVDVINIYIQYISYHAMARGMSWDMIHDGTWWRNSWTHIWLVVSTHLKNMKVNWDDEIPNVWKSMFQTTNQTHIHIHILISQSSLDFSADPEVENDIRFTKRRCPMDFWGSTTVSHSRGHWNPQDFFVDLTGGSGWKQKTSSGYTQNWSNMPLNT